MIETIVAIFTGLSSAVKTAEVLKKLLRGKKGDTRALLEELKKNLVLCWLLVERGTDPMKVIPKFATSEYDRILRTEFNFNAMKRKRIRRSEKLEKSDLSSLIGKETKDLIENIYDKIKELKWIYEVDRENPRILWGRRIFNVHKRMLLLIQHLRT